MPKNKSAYSAQYNPFSYGNGKKQTAKKRRKKTKSKGKGILLLVVLILFCGILGLLSRQKFEIVRVSGTAMEDALHDGSVVILQKNVYSSDAVNPERGDVVAVDVGNNGFILRRVIGLPGESITWNGMGDVAINGETYRETYISNTSMEIYESMDLATQRYYVLCDDRSNLYDSRASEIGAVPKYKITGRVSFVLWPLSDFGTFRP